MAIAESFCIGCGDNFEEGSSDIIIRSLSAGRVQQTWRSLLEKKLEDAEVITITCDDLVADVGVMCKTCFSSIERFSKLECTINSNLDQLVKGLSSITVSPRRKVRRVVSNNKSLSQLTCSHVYVD